MLFYKNQKPCAAVMLALSLFSLAGCASAVETGADVSVETETSMIETTTYVTQTSAAKAETTQTQTECETEAKAETEDQTAETAETTEAETETEIPAETEAETQAQTEPETKPLAETETEAETESGGTDMDASDTTAADFQTYAATAYACTVDVPADWTAASGASGMEITDEICIFEPVSETGDSIMLVIQEGADSEEDFAAVTQDVVVSAMEEYMDSVTVTDWASMTIDGCSAYRMQITGSADDVTFQMEQLVVNCRDDAYGNYQYSLTYTNVSGEASPYTETLDAYFHLTSS